VSNLSHLSTKQIDVKERLIFALDFESKDKALEMVERLGDSVVFYKLGLELFMAGGYHELLDRLVKQGKKVFVDLKFFDVPQTVGSAVRQLKDTGATFATVHGNDKILEAAVEAKGDLKILAVTVLTSLDRRDLDDLGFKCDVEALVLSRARRAMQLGCDGVISSGLEAKALRGDLDSNFLIVTPGIRPVDNIRVDDQKRTVDVEEAFLNGADYIVVGRPIKLADDPYKTAQDIQTRISKVFSSTAIA
jgi:orotidine-5'-phosphate decarboxylase